MKLKEKHLFTLLSIATGLLAAFSFPKINLFFLMWIAFIPLIHIIRKSSVKQSFLYAFLAGAVFNLQANFWLIDTVRLFSDNYFISISFYILFCLYFTVYWGLWGIFLSIAKKYCVKPWIFVVLSACLWIILEYIRTYALTGWPWLIISYSQYLFTHIIQIAEFTGIYGVSFVIMLVNGFLYFGLIDKKKSYIYAAVSLFAIVLVFGMFRYNSFQSFGEKEYAVAAVQSNVEQYKKFDNSHKKEINASLEEFAQELAEIGADINVWSESEIINLIPADMDSYIFADKIAKKAGKFNIIGAPYLDGNGKLFNAVFYFDGKGGYVSMHKKNHLVPFGEYMPISEKVADFFEIPGKRDDLIRGDDTAVFTDGELFVGALICSENFFPNIVSRFILSGAKVLTNHTNDAWYLDSSAPFKHFSANVFRSVESRKAMIVAANTGISAIIDASGKIAISTQVYERVLIVGTFLQNDYLTFYVLYGDVFVKICIIFVAVFIVVIIFRRFKLKNGIKTNL